MAEPESAEAPSRADLVRRLRWQANSCRELGSPLYGFLLDAVARDTLEGGPGAAVLVGHENDPGPSAIALRLMGAVHRLVLERRAPELATFFPSVGGTGAIDRSWPALRRVLEEHRDHLRDVIDQPPQTNEVGRSAALIGGLLHVVDRWPGPVRLFEIGASGGLNLRADQFRVELPDGTGVGPADAPVVLTDPWRGRMPPVAGRLEVVERRGCDTCPVDPTTEAGRLRLTSFVWPDQRDRLERLRGALAVAARVPAALVRQSARDFVHDLRLEPGTTAVVWHSIMWQYLDAAEQAEVGSRLESLGETASAQARLAHLRLEPGRRTPASERRVLVTLRMWPRGQEQLLGSAPPHGLPTTWE